MRQFFLSLLLLTSLNAREVPRLSGPVVDEVGVLDGNVRRALSGALRNLQKSSGNQLQLLVVDTLDGESIDGFSIRVMDKWKLGSSALDNGVLFLLAMKERRVRIEVGQGLEGQLTDIITGRIIDLITPYFGKGDYSTGIVIGMNAIASTIGQDLYTSAKQIPHKNLRKKSPSRGAGLFFIIFFLVFLLGRGRRGGVGGIGWLFLGSMLGRGSSSWGGGGGFSGGSWGGGGGGFSGGGASGSW